VNDETKVKGKERMLKNCEGRTVIKDEGR